MNLSEFANNWINDWNSHDFEKILAHYSDDIEVTTPMIQISLGIETGTLYGKLAVASYWQNALKKFPDLNFELIEVTESINSVAIYYKSVMNKRAIEVMFFNEQGKVNKMIAFYTF
jgi:hypothetical protein